MKKIILGIIGMCAMMSASANNNQEVSTTVTTVSTPAAEGILGSWVSNDLCFMNKNNMPGELKKFVMTFNFGKSTFKASFEAECAIAQADEALTVGIQASLNGEYSLVGDSLSLEVDPKTSKASITKFDLPKEVLAQIEAGGMSKDMLLKMMNDQLSKDAFTGFDAFNGKICVKSVTDDQLMLESGEQTITFIRKE